MKTRLNIATQNVIDAARSLAGCRSCKGGVDGAPCGACSLCALIDAVIHFNAYNAQAVVNRRDKYARRLEKAAQPKRIMP